MTRSFYKHKSSMFVDRTVAQIRVTAYLLGGLSSLENACTVSLALTYARGNFNP
jgi:hypothetical protein